MITIYADIHEKGKVTDILRHKCDLIEKQLDVADYILSERVGVERKTSSDFAQSVIDGRLFRQLGELKDSFERPVIIIEGRELFDGERNIHPNSIRGAVASVATEFSVPIIWTKTPLETSEILLVIAKREQLNMKSSVAVRGQKKAKSMNQTQEFLIAGLPQINTQTAKKLLKHFGSPEKIFSAREEDLTKTDGVGPKTAKRIRKILSQEYEKSILED